jgi:hypothetical protein
LGTLITELFDCLTNTSAKQNLAWQSRTQELGNQKKAYGYIWIYRNKEER